jgi:hypothetical protein
MVWIRHEDKTTKIELSTWNANRKYYEKNTVCYRHHPDQRRQQIRKKSILLHLL